MRNKREKKIKLDGQQNKQKKEEDKNIAEIEREPKNPTGNQKSISCWLILQTRGSQPFFDRVPPNEHSKFLRTPLIKHIDIGQRKNGYG